MMGGEKLTEEDLVKEVITPNLSDSWIKPFKLNGTHQYNGTKKVMNILEVLESNEQLQQGNQHKQSNKQE